MSVTTNRAITRPMSPSHHPDSPSLYSTKMNPTYTRADPVSLSATMISMGSAITAAAIMKCLNLDSLNPCWLMIRASTSEVVIFEISAGWKLTGPSVNHEWDPFTSLETNITSTSRASTARYRGIDSPSQSFGGSTNRISPPSPKAVSIHMNCFPLLALQSNMDDGSVE